ncbi:sensor histidine kinase [Agrococcus terreus]|uniref:histidine kinase n=1 Tax=Agrococcus terreus TaxID=574649 RepID=A0ABQ2KJD0_9MICO|nr:ATP-binding protein [Agrococcus terreus]GGN83800.1 hypothetical protein GCM10010968_14970 [Agrococcus terreus]
MPGSAAGVGVPSRLWRLLVAQCLIVLACVGATTAVAVAVQERAVRAATEARVLDVARSLASLEQVQAAVVGPREAAMAELQPLADLLGESGGVDYVVIADADGVRLAHPTPAERGRALSTDAAAVLRGEVFVGVEEGTLGPTLRAKVPIVRDGAVVGVASVGIAEHRLAASTAEATGSLTPWVAGALVVGVALSAAVGAVVARRIRRLEDDVRELEAQRRVADALRDQAHEFHTRLHAIRGLVAEGEPTAALDYIGGLVPVGEGVDAALDDPALRALVEGLAAAATSAGGALEVDPGSSVPAGALVDADLEVVANLVRNAIESRPGARVRLLVAADADALLVQVDDDGPGIAPEEVARVFERGVSGKGAGRGLGLGIVARHVRDRGGEATVGRSPDGGARLLVELPLAAVPR